MTVTQQHYEVAIVGGGIAGVTLALIFEKLNISYTLLEARDTLESDRGAGIGLQPNGLRILDQLGLIEEIEKVTIPLRKWYSYDAEGNLMSDSSAMGLYRERIGYPVTFIERPKLLSIMLRHMQRTECVKTSAKVAFIEETDEHVVITTLTGHTVTADMVIGADGVRSAVRNYIDSFSPRTKANPGDYITINSSTVYGMSSPTLGILPGERFAVYREHETVIGFTGLDGIIFWFVFENLDQSIPLSQSPRYTPAEVEPLCQRVAHVRITPDLTFGDLYHNRVVAVKIPVEEGVPLNWHTDRAVIVGDAACKMTPAGGQGANQAIESCAVLVNKIMEARRRAISPGGKMSREEVRSALASYAQARAPASAVALERSQMVFKALFCVPGRPSEMVKNMLKASDEEWLVRAFSALSSAPVLDDVELTARGQLYKETVLAAQAGLQSHNVTANSKLPGTKPEKAAETPKFAERREAQNLANSIQAANELVEVS